MLRSGKVKKHEITVLVICICPEANPQGQLEKVQGSLGVINNIPGIFYVFINREEGSFIFLCIFHPCIRLRFSLASYLMSNWVNICSIYLVLALQTRDDRFLESIELIRIGSRLHQVHEVSVKQTRHTFQHKQMNATLRA